MSVTPLTPPELAAFAKRAAGLRQLDRPAYEKHGRDPLVPIIGLGPKNARLCIMGRDPGDDEVRLGQPFVGASGQMLRKRLHGHLHGDQAYGASRGMAAGESMFWLNTVPYKPAGNKAWPLTVQRAFHPLMLGLLMDRWNGCDVLTLGSHAFDWFAIGQAPAEVDRMRQFWTSGDPYLNSLDVTLRTANAERALRLHPLPHPSPANARWHARFPELLQARLSHLLPGR